MGEGSVWGGECVWEGEWVGSMWGVCGGGEYVWREKCVGEGSVCGRREYVWEGECVGGGKCVWEKGVCVGRGVCVERRMCVESERYVGGVNPAS